MKCSHGPGCRGRSPLFLTAEEAVALIPDGAAVSIEGSGGGLLEPDLLLKTLGERHTNTGAPRDLTVVHCTGIGDLAGGGLDLLAHPKMLKRVIGGNWGMAPRMSELALSGAMEAYNIPQGVVSQLYREIAAARPGLITHVGIDTFCDPRDQGGRLNEATTEPIVEVIEIGGREWLLYHTFPIDFAFIRATTADEHGNLTMEQEGARLEALAIAQATRNAGGTVIAQVKRRATAGSLDPRTVEVPGILVDVVVVNDEQRQTVAGEYNPAFSGELRVPMESLPALPAGPRRIIARRAAMELECGAVTNLGVGMADGVASVVTEADLLDHVTFTVEQGIIGGVSARGVLFGVAYNPTAFLDQPAQFDFYDGGGLDIAFLGFAQVDAQGNVNVSRFGDTLKGTGGFVNISQNARTVVFCGTFTAGGLAVSVDAGKMKIDTEGRHDKFVAAVDQVTFNAAHARRAGQRILYVTERAVFELTDTGLALREVASGVDVQRDVLDRLPFEVATTSIETMPAHVFSDEHMELVFDEVPAAGSIPA